MNTLTFKQATLAAALAFACALPMAAGAADTVGAPGTDTLALFCKNCGHVVSVVPYKVKGSSSGVGIVGGAVVGGLLGHTLIGGGARTIATVAGAGGGAYAGNAIERNMNSKTRYRVTVQMEDGSTRVFREAAPGWRRGDRVRVENGRLTADS